MWDPALRFEEVRRVHLPGYAVASSSKTSMVAEAQLMRPA